MRTLNFVNIKLILSQYFIFHLLLGMKNKCGFRKHTKRAKDKSKCSFYTSENIQQQQQSNGFKAKNILIDLTLQEQSLTPISLSNPQKKQEQRDQNISKWEHISNKMSLNLTSHYYMTSQRLNKVTKGDKEVQQRDFLRTLTKNNSLFYKSPKFVLLKSKRKQFLSENLVNVNDDSKDISSSISQQITVQTSKSCCIRQIQIIGESKGQKTEGKYLKRKCFQLHRNSEKNDLLKDHSLQIFSNNNMVKKDRKKFDIVYRTHKLKKPQIISIMSQNQKISISGNSFKQLISKKQS